MAFGVNHLGHFLLTLLLLDRLKQAEHSRVVNVTALLHRLGSVDFNLLNTQKDLVTGQSYWHALRAYCHSKLCNVLFTRELANQLEGTSVTCYCLHPGQWGIFCLLRHKYYYSFPPLHFLHCLIFKGVIATEIGRNMGVLQKWLFLPMSKLFFLDPEGGTQTTLYCALQEGLEPLSGRYFSSCALQNVSAQGRDDALAKKLWEVSERLCGLSWVSPHRFVEQQQRDHQQLYECELLKFFI